ncbi:MAG: toxin-antitoxin system HicB family antitoxin [Chloroflexota bacterium]
MSKPTVLTLRVPADLKLRMSELAAQQGVSLNQFAMYMLTTKITEMEASVFFDRVKGDKSSAEIRAEFTDVMAKIRQRSTPDDTQPWDEMPE